MVASLGVTIAESREASRPQIPCFRLVRSARNEYGDWRAHVEMVPAVAVSRGRAREFWCSVVSETVMIRLRRPGGFGRPQGYFVQCNQGDCQYVDENKPPCPLHVGMFAEEIRAAEQARGRAEEP
jgi:hypothetical protein